MNPDEELLRAIANAGGLNPIDFLRDVVAVDSSDEFMEIDSGLMTMLLEHLKCATNDSYPGIIKAILWDARTATVVARDLSAERKAYRLDLLDQIGLHLFPPASGQGCRVELTTADLTNALHALEAAQQFGRVCISLQDNHLVFSRSRTSVRVPAAGTWPMTAVVTRAFVKDLLSREADLPITVIVTGDDTTIHFSHYSIRCRWKRKTPA